MYPVASSARSPRAGAVITRRRIRRRWLRSEHEVSDDAHRIELTVHLIAKQCASGEQDTTAICCALGPALANRIKAISGQMAVW